MYALLTSPRMSDATPLAEKKPQTNQIKNPIKTNSFLWYEYSSTSLNCQKPFLFVFIWDKATFRNALFSWEVFGFLFNRRE